MRKVGDMIRLSAAGLLRLALAQIMNCATRGISESDLCARVMLPMPKESSHAE